MPRTILLVDDDRALVDALARRLRSAEHRIITATTGEEALHCLASTTVDAMVSDESMPMMSGVELLTEVHRRWPEVVTIMLSGRATAGTIVRALNQGQIFRFLIKPCDADEVAESLRQAIAHKRVIERSREILPLSRRMHDLLAAAERLHPGILRQAEAELRKITIRADDFQDIEQLADRLAVEISSASEYLPVIAPDEVIVNPLIDRRGLDATAARTEANQ
ncbi:MAG: response regulator [Planctomycetes bacterium]|nr:response regulator [Planctomycetota bacterium]